MRPSPSTIRIIQVEDSEAAIASDNHGSSRLRQNVMHDIRNSFGIDKVEEKRDTPLNNLWEYRKNPLKAAWGAPAFVI